MNNQNGINEQNEVVTPVGVAENNSFSSNETVTTPHDLSRIQELVNQLESNIQRINSGASEDNGNLEAKPSFMDTVYQNSIADGSMKQVVQGEIYVGKNPTLAKFVEETKTAVLQTLQEQMRMNGVSFSDSKNQGIPSLELTTPTLFGESKEVSPAPIEISGPPLRPENIFDDEEVLGEEPNQERSKVA